MCSYKLNFMNLLVFSNIFCNFFFVYKKKIETEGTEGVWLLLFVNGISLIRTVCRLANFNQTNPKCMQ